MLIKESSNVINDCKKKIVDIKFIDYLNFMKKINHFIDGKIYTEKNARLGKVFNPAIGEQIAEVE